MPPVILQVLLEVAGNIVQHRLAICSNTIVYVGVTIFALCWSALRPPGSCRPLESEPLIRCLFSSSSGSEEVSSLLSVPNVDSGILSVIPIALFISEAVRATASLLLSYTGGDKACLVGTTHSYSAWAALQHGISAVFALAKWQFTAEGVDEGVSERSTEFGHQWFHVARVHDHSPLPVTLLDSYAFYATGNLASPHSVFEFCTPVEV